MHDFDWYCTQAALGSAEACGRLAFAMINAHGTKRDPVGAFHLAKRGSEDGDPTAMAVLATCYMLGHGALISCVCLILCGDYLHLIKEAA